MSLVNDRDSSKWSVKQAASPLKREKSLKPEVKMNMKHDTERSCALLQKGEWKVKVGFCGRSSHHVLLRF